MTGAGEVLKLARPEIKIIGAEPENAALLSGKDWAPHKIQGWTPDFIPGVLDKKVLDEIVLIPDDGAIDTAQRLATEEGIFYGISGGATMWAALKVAETAPADSTFLVMLPDTGERYLSTPLTPQITSTETTAVRNNAVGPSMLAVNTLIYSEILICNVHCVKSFGV